MNRVLTIIACAFVLCAAPDLTAAPFPGAGGNYGGLAQTDDNDPLAAGLVNIDLLETGTFSGSVLFQGNKYPLQGRFDAETADFEKSFPVPDAPGVTLVVRAQLFAADRFISGTVEQQSGGSSFQTAFFNLSGAAPDPVLGPALSGSKRTAFIDPPNSGNEAGSSAAPGAPAAQEIPGDGFSVITVGRSKARAARFVGQLPDAAKYSSGSRLRGANYTVFSTLYKKKLRKQRATTGGQTLGQAEVFGNGGSSPELQSQLVWGKKEGVEPEYYGDGIKENLFINDAQLYPRLGKGALVPIGVNPRQRENATIRIKRGNLVDGMEVRMTITARGVKVEKTLGVPEEEGANPYQLQVRINAPQGTFAGSFVHPDSGEKTKFAGAFQAAIGLGNEAFPGEGRGSFKGSVDPRNPAHAGQLPESGSVRIMVNAER